MSALIEALRKLDLSPVTNYYGDVVYQNTKSATDFVVRHFPAGEELMRRSEQFCDAGFDRLNGPGCQAVRDSNAARDPQPLAPMAPSLRRPEDSRER